jgi:translocation and assembly module TamA
VNEIGLHKRGRRREPSVCCVSTQLIAILLCTIATALPRLGFTGEPEAPYHMVIEGLTDPSLKKLLESISETTKLAERPPVSIELLQRRVKGDVELFQKALRSRGFYAASVTSEIDGDTEPVQIIFRVNSGSPYLLKSVDIEMVDSVSVTEIKPPSPEDLGLILGRPAESRILLDGEKALIRWFRARGFPFPTVLERKVVVDHAVQGVTVDFLVHPGPRGYFGHTEIEGLESVKEDFLLAQLPWKEGDPFNADLLTLAQSRLQATGLLATVQVKSGERLEEKDLLPVTIIVKERKHRTIKGGANYQTDEGFGGKISWENRNMFGRGERLLLALVVSEIAYAAESEFRKPCFLHNEQSLVWDFRLAEDHPDAYDSQNITSSLMIERTLMPGMKMGGGLAFRFSDVEQAGNKELFSLIFLPVNFDWDASDDILDPSRGGRLAVKIAPFLDIMESDLAFTEGYARYSHYIRVTSRPFMVLAGRGSFGSIVGAGRDEIPADLRFYAGGGGSIRGYAYQSVGPVKDGDPIGGRSLLELSAELRVKVSRHFGLVGFLDGGNAYEGMLPDFDEELRWGAGMGVRYYTPVGPLRLDVGVPLNPRNGVDDDFQLYISIGQAF